MRRACQRSIDSRVVLRKTTIMSRLKPCGDTKSAAILPAMNKTVRPITGEKRTGISMGLLITPFTDLKGVKVSPSSVLVQT